LRGRGRFSRDFYLSVPPLANARDCTSIYTAFFAALVAELHGGLRALETEIERGAYNVTTAFRLDKHQPSELTLNIHAVLPRTTDDVVARAWTVATGTPPFVVRLRMAYMGPNAFYGRTHYTYTTESIPTDRSDQFRFTQWRVTDSAYDR
jgi:hypothetical protein